MLSRFVHNLRPCLLGLAFVHMWIYCSTHRFLDSGGVSVTAVLYSAMSVALVAIGVGALRAGKGTAGEGQGGTRGGHATSAAAARAGAERARTRAGHAAPADATTPAAAGTGSEGGAEQARARGGRAASGDAVAPAAAACTGSQPPSKAQRPSLALDLAAAALMALGGVALSVELPLPAAVPATLGSVLGGLGVAWAYGRWVQVYARLDLAFSAPLLFCTMALGSACKTVIDFLPGAAAAPVFVCLPFATFFCVRRAASSLPEGPEPERYYTARTVGSLTRVVVSVAAFSFTFGIIRTAILEGTPDPYILSVLVNHGTEILLALVFVWWVCIAGRGVDFGRTWRLILILMVTVLVFEPFLAGSWAHATLFALVRTAHALLVVFFLFLAVADVARHSSYPALAVYAAGWLAYSLPFAAGSAVGALMAASPVEPLVTSIATWALVVVALVLLDDRSLGNRLIFAELNHAEDDSPEMHALATQRNLETRASAGPAAGAAERHSRCQRLAKKGGLTAREAEVLELLVRGHSKTRIAETFLISENTVRGHVKHIYAKLGVHSKQELLDLVEG